ncbi:MAG: transketolase [Candidatus Accumulibacter sp.]|jgi:transketolase|nr:transketolase [Accumulibacter sp.]
MVNISIEQRYTTLSGQFKHWEKIKDLVDQNIDLMINFAQSGHPGGSRSKVHAFVALLFCGEFRWDIRHPEKAFGDRFILSAGHAVPLIYGALAILNEAFRIKHAQTDDERYRLDPRFAVFQEDLDRFRRNGGLSGHAEMQGKTLFLKWNAGPSGHGLPAAAGQALGLKRAGAGEVKVVALEGEGGLTPGASHEAKNSAWGLGLSNLFFLIDWNDFGIDERPTSSVVHGTPEDWFKPYGWNVFRAEDGSAWSDLARGYLQMFDAQASTHVPSVLYFRTRKGRGYGVFDNKSHGAPHKLNSEAFWRTKEEFSRKYGVEFANFGQPAPADPAAIDAQAAQNLQAVAGVLKRDQALVDYITDTLLALADAVPETPARPLFDLTRNPLDDASLFDADSYPAELFAPPGAMQSTRAGFGKWGSYINSLCREKYGRPLFLACSADLAESTNVADFGKDFGQIKNFGWYEREKNVEGVILPQEITEFANSAIMAALATTNLSRDPFHEFSGFYGVCSTYGAFSYLKYGEMRVLSQMAQDCEIKFGKVLWVAGHSGVETAEDARTHYGVFSPAITQLFPDGQVINLYPTDYNEVPILLAAAMNSASPIVALHLTRPPLAVPDRPALGIASYREAARGAYLIRDFDPALPKMGTLIVQGTITTANVIGLLPELAARALNLKIVAATSPELFRLQGHDYRERILPASDWMDSTVITNMSRRSMYDWIASKVSAAYALSSDFDDRWRTGGRLGEITEEAHLSREWLLKGIQRFVDEREQRRKALALD